MYQPFWTLEKIQLHSGLGQSIAGPVGITYYITTQDLGPKWRIYVKQSKSEDTHPHVSCGEKIAFPSCWWLLTRSKTSKLEAGASMSLVVRRSPFLPAGDYWPVQRLVNWRRELLKMIVPMNLKKLFSSTIPSPSRWEEHPSFLPLTTDAFEDCPTQWEWRVWFWFRRLAWKAGKHHNAWVRYFTDFSSQAFLKKRCMYFT